MTDMKKKKSAGEDKKGEEEGGHDPAAKHTALLHAAAGAVAGCISRFVVGPLDVIKIRFQVQLEPIAARAPGAVATPSKYTGIGQALVTIVKEEGIKGLWRGTIPGQLLTIPYTAVQFVTLHHCKQLAKDLGLAADPRWAPSVSFVSGALAGAAGTVASYPFDLLRTTLAAQGEPKVYASMSDAARGIVAQHGVKGLYRGLGITVLEIMPYAALQFGLYDILMKYYSRVRCMVMMEPEGSPPTGLQSFLCGLAAGTVAKLGSHPLDVAKKRFQVAGLQRSTRYGQRVAPEACQHLGQVIHDIYVREGLAGLYKGAMPSIIKAAPAAAVTFCVYEALLRLYTDKQQAQQAARQAAPQAQGGQLQHQRGPAAAAEEGRRGVKLPAGVAAAEPLPEH